MILLLGPPDDRCLELVYEELQGVAPRLTCWVPQTIERSAQLEYAVEGAVVRGILQHGDLVVDLESVSAVYARLADLSSLAPRREDHAHSSGAESFLDASNRWIDLCPALVINRNLQQLSNASKPVQLDVLRRIGFCVPTTVITNNPSTVLGFLRVYDRVIFKSVSWIRSIVREFAPEDFRRLDRIKSCPVQFQEYVRGTDLRIHVVGSTVLGVAIDTEATDYRYAERVGHPEPSYEAFIPEPALASLCVAVRERLGLEFVGIDLRLTPEGDYVAFEVNPSPGYEFYERKTGQRISQVVAEHLLAAESSLS